MAQVAIREYDAKHIFAKSHHGKYPYHGILIESDEDIKNFLATAGDDALFVIKPDQLFGKRGKYGLVGVKLDKYGIQKWWQEHHEKTVTIGKQTGKLTTFLIEDFVAHSEEYYVAISSARTHDTIFFSKAGGMEVEENWDKVASLDVSLIGDLHPETIASHFDITDARIIEFLMDIYETFKVGGFAYLEVNPFTFDQHGDIVCLDMVARIDNTESFKQKILWQDLVITNPFGAEKSEAEKYIDELDSQTGASLKFRILNPHGRIWLLTSGGGASVITADTLGNLGLANEIGNYGECSGNPDRENTRAYADTLIRTMLDSGKTDMYLIISGAIANFTHIDKTFAGIIDALTDHAHELRTRGVKLLVRRGGINDRAGLSMMQRACEELGIPCEIADGDSYMTDILQKILISK